METVDKDVESTDNNKTFINRILGEMKNQFNKTDNNMQVSTSCNNLNADKNEVINNSNNLDTHDNGTTTPTIVEVQENNANFVQGDEVEQVTEVKEEQVSQEIADCTVNNINNKVDESDSIKEEDESSECVDEKPRIVLTFRKPTTESFKAKAKNEGRRTLRAKLRIVEDTMILKRSPRRSSRDCNESVLQSAIARKEKSYNESNKPQRLTKQLKATPKILENIANAALKLEKTRVDKGKGSKGEKQEESDNEENSEENMLSESDGELEKNFGNKKTKRRNSKSKHKVKKAKVNSCSKDTDSDHSSVQDSDSKCNDNKVKKNRVEDKACRRSHRLSSRLKDEMSLDESGELLEPNTAEQDSQFPADPECSSVEAQLIASQLCLCTQKTQLYVSAGEDEEDVYCMAIDSIGDRLVGCNNVADVNKVAMLRPSGRVPYALLCDTHYHRMLRHNCCPKCGLFCTRGRFVQCNAKHQYHRECQISIGEAERCPHCGLATPKHDVLINMHTVQKPVFLPLQKPHFPTAKMNFSSVINNDVTNDKDEFSLSIVIPNSENLVLQPGLLNEDEAFNIEVLCKNIKENNLESVAAILASRIISLTVSNDQYEGGTVLHFASKHGLPSILHMLVLAGAELDVFDKEQNTPLSCAILAFKNDSVKYLVKAGSSITLKGTDGMTALHLAAKSGNLVACKLLWKASVGIKDYLNVTDDGGWTALVWACEHGHSEVAKYLIVKGADPLLRDVEQNLALHWAAFSGSTEAAELLLNHKSDVNAVNAHGDSPLHIASRQNMYDCIILLMARGALTNVINKVSETPLDCCKPYDKCYSAISLNLHLQSLVSVDNKVSRTLLENDISNGREQNPIQCVNEEDDTKLPEGFIYINSNCVTVDEIQIDRKITSMHSCNCEYKCSTFDCVCCDNSLKCWYNEEGRLLDNFNYFDPPMIFECNQLCSCNSITCNNRIVQHGITQRFQLFKTKSKDWGIRTLRKIIKGSFVCEYVGEIITDFEADQREDDCYVFDLDARENQSYCIDAKRYGNFARFINHSCDSNLVPIRVFVDHHDLRFPRIAFFAKKDILAYEELSFDYGERFWIVKYKSFTCDCRSENCKYSEQTIASTIEKYNKTVQEERVDEAMT